VLPIAVDAATHARLFELLAGNPDAELTVDLAEQGVLLPDGSTIDFEIDSFAKQMILAGTDELGYLLSKTADISAWEDQHPARVDTLAGVG
jgi:3-isopropylmalate/(R)-2-methylmalate dehydratase small subunit